MSHSFENGLLYLLIELVNGNYATVACELLKQESPDLLSNYVQNNTVDPKRHGPCVSWAKRHKREKTLTVRRLCKAYGFLNSYRVTIRRSDKSTFKSPNPKKKAKLSRNARITAFHVREKHGIKILNSVKEALLLYKLSGGSL